jgi:hypothetical protein
MLLIGREDLGAGAKPLTYDGRHFQLRKGVFSLEKWLFTLQTPNATPTALVWDAENEVMIPNTVYGFEGFATAQYVAAATSAAYRIQGAIKMGANAAATALVGTPLVTAYEDTAGMDLTVTADTTLGRPQLNATGVAATVINWRAELWIYRLTQTGG